MTRKAEDFAPGQYLIALSPRQLALLLGTEIATTVGDHYCRISPSDPTILDLWLTTSTCAGGTYERNPVEKSRDWNVYTVEGVYYDNDQAYTQTVLAANESMAIDEAQRIAWFSAQGHTEDQDFEPTLDEDTIEANAGYGEDNEPVTVRNANRYPEQAIYLASWVLADPRYQTIFVAENGPYGYETLREGVGRVSEAAIAFLNEMSQDDADMLQDDDAATFVEEFFAPYVK